MKIVYICTACSESKHKAITQKYKDKNQKNVQQLWDFTLSTELSNIFKNDFFCIAYPPVSTFPASKCIYFSKKYSEESITNFSFIHCNNVPVFKQLSEMIKIKRMVKKIIKTEKEKVVILTHCINYQSYKAVKKLQKKNNNVLLLSIVPDLPEHMLGASFNQNRLLNKLYSIYKKKNISIKSGYDGYICFSEAQMNYLNQTKPFIVMEGFVNYEEIDKIKKTEEKKKTIVYAGGISFRYGIKELIGGFLSTGLKDVDLVLYGAGDAVEYVNSIRNDNLKYMGLVDKKTVISAEKGASILINPRPTNEEYSWCSFPSKILEYLSTGVPVLTTKLLCFSAEYDNYLNYLNDLSPESIAKGITNAFKNYDELSRKAILAKEFVKNNKNSKKQAILISNFLNNV